MLQRWSVNAWHLHQPSTIHLSIREGICLSEEVAHELVVIADNFPCHARSTDGHVRGGDRETEKGGGMGRRKEREGEGERGMQRAIMMV